ncbi:M48 family metallopeptidase [Aestuariibius sp. 2305UL40-4]|uniref:M48 family metallopeptidase n=1 Tax=Aestuariibius violaceus TaxID=3234132 RepID=UPI00345EDDED
MGRLVLPGKPPIEITLRRSRRSRRLSLRVSSLDGKVTMTIPERVDQRMAQKFAAEREAWLRRTLQGQQPPSPVAGGATVLFEGREIRVETGPERRTRLEGDVLRVPASRAVPASVKAFLKALARERLAAASDKYAARVGQDFRQIALRDTRSRWGSCSSDGRLMYSWRLIMAPPEVLDYVAAHEVAHLVHLDHSPAFWALVGEICPSYGTHRTWLRDNGASLHRYRFDPVPVA